MLEVWISVGSATVTVVAAGVAGWQAREARRQARAAEDQVREARRSAVAAEDQVEIMRRQHEADQAERDERAAERAALVTIEMGDSSAHYGNNNVVWAVTITNHSNQSVGRPQIESMGEVPVRWGWKQVRLVHEEGSEFVHHTAEMLLPSGSTDVPYQYVDADGRPFGHDGNCDWFFDDKLKSVCVDDVTITFSMSGARWQRTGNRVPVRLS